MIDPNFAQLAGVNTNVSPFLMPKGGATVLNRCNPTYKLGAMLKDPGYSRVSTQIQDNKSITGLFDFVQSASVQRVLATVNDSTDDDTQLFAKTPAGEWSEITAAETAWANYANINVEMESFIGYAFFVGHGSTDGFLPVGSLTGTTFSTSTNVTNMPNAKYIKRFRDRLYVANCSISGTAYPYRVYFSSVPSAGAISWTVASDFIDVDYSDQVTGLSENWDVLMIFTEYSAYKYDQSQFKKVWDIGCSNNRTISNHGAVMMWANYDGVWMSVGGGYPQNIGGEVIDFIRNGTPRNFFSPRKLIDEEYHLYVGNVTVNGVSYSNVILTYNLPTQTWRWGEYYSNFTVFAHYNNSGKIRLYMGDNDGNVWDKAKYTDATLISVDASITGVGQPIGSNFELAPVIFNPAMQSKLRRIHAYAERAQGLKLKARIVDKNTRALTPYRSLGTLEKYVTSLDVDLEDGVLIQIAGSEYGSLPYWSFFGYVLELENESVILK